MTVRDPEPDERSFYVVRPDGSTWMDEPFRTREAAIEEAGRIGYGGKKFITTVIAVVED